MSDREPGPKPPPRWMVGLNIAPQTWLTLGSQHLLIVTAADREPRSTGVDHRRGGPAVHRGCILDAMGEERQSSPCLPVRARHSESVRWDELGGRPGPGLRPSLNRCQVASVLRRQTPDEIVAEPIDAGLRRRLTSRDRLGSLRSRARLDDGESRDD
jgi:hypothetical protein